MRICVTSEGPTLDSRVDARFGRGRYFIFVDTDTMEFEAVENPGVNAMSGAGIQAAQLVAEKGAKVAITGGNFGPKAADTLSSFGVEMIGGFSGTVREAVEKFKAGQLGAGSAGGYQTSQNVQEEFEEADPEAIKKKAIEVSENIEKAKDKVNKLIEGR